MTKNTIPFSREAIENDAGLGAGDESKCLPGWIESFGKWHDKGEGTTLSKHAVAALFHTLLAARERARRLVRERDEARRSGAQVVGVHYNPQDIHEGQP